MKRFVTKKIEHVRRDHFRDMLVLGLPFFGVVLAAVAGWIPKAMLPWIIPILLVVWL